MLKTVTYSEYIVLRIIHKIRVISADDDSARVFIER